MLTKKEELKSVRQRKYLAKDFDGFRAQLLEYTRLYYPDRLKDFSESSMGGLFLDMACYVGDNLSFYLDHQYGELNSSTTTEISNVQKHLQAAGVPISGASPAIVPVNIYVQIPAEYSAGSYVPMVSAIPIVQSNSVFHSDSGVSFTLVEDVDFRKKRTDGNYVATIKIGQKQSDGTPKTFVMSVNGLCVSGVEVSDTFDIGSSFVRFRELTLSFANVTDIISVYDSYGNEYYNVSSLTHDVVYKNVLNTSSDSDLVKDAIKIIPAPYRYTSKVSLSTRKTTLIFGGGTADTLEDDIIPDPSDFAIAFPYSRTFSRISINPQQLLQTKTLGVATTSTTMTVKYRYGGGLNHNVKANTIRNISTISTYFPGNPSSTLASSVRSSIEVSNQVDALGGEDAPSVQDLQSIIPSIRNSQERIVSKEDLLARVYSIPSNFGRVFRAAVRPNNNNALATQLYIISRDSAKKLIIAPDTLKTNLRKYLNPYRLITDAIDILDAKIINLTFDFEVMIDPMLNRTVVLQQISKKLQEVFDIKNVHIDQPLVYADISSIISAVRGVVSIDRISFTNINNVQNNRLYSNISFDVASNSQKGFLIPPPGGIFEIRYPEHDIFGRAI